ncbi:MAG TPA: LuxR C-terminal-related transcriptional regulator, partial [Burkholderiaceae bacterium]|nr:LuxR C-terminal-related transcriptional regulator [Burkholderiaceae bacterium]
ECVEQGYLLLPVIEQHLRRSDGAAAAALAAGAVAIGERFADADLIACARHLLGRAWIQQRRVDEGLALLDEAMVAVTADELSPLMTGLVYCSVIDSCQQICDVRRAREWTSALAQWCDRQPQLVAFTDACLVHRAEILQLNGAWTEAIAEATRACERPARQGAPHAPAAAFYQQAEVYRLRGELEAAERAYRLASQSGADPQPGLALLRLAQRRPDAAATQIRRVLLETADPLLRAKLLPAFIEIMLANAQLDEARAALEELQRCAESLGAALLRAQAAQAQGAIELAGGEPQAALVPLRAACHAWQHLDVPYEVGRTRMLIGAACRAIGDRDGAELELQAARQLFERLQARPDVARVDSLLQRGSPDGRANLTAREVQVLRSVAAGKTNREIAAELSLSEKTVDRHVSNIFDKLGVSSRAAATASAYENGLI